MNLRFLPTRRRLGCGIWRRWRGTIAGQRRVSDTPPRYTGTLRRTPEGIEGELRTVWGWSVQFTGTLVDGAYVLTGHDGPVPEWLRIEALDGEVPG